jgi:hypothetical protein
MLDKLLTYIQDGIIFLLIFTDEYSCNKSMQTFMSAIYYLHCTMLPLAGPLIFVLTMRQLFIVQTLSSPQQKSETVESSLFNSNNVSYTYDEALSGEITATRSTRQEVRRSLMD